MRITDKKQREVTKKGLFTFIMQYMGGTYIDQVKAINECEAMRLWIINLNVSEIKGLLLSDKKRIIRDNFDNENPLPIKKRKNVWFCFLDTAKGYGLVNIVKTDT